MTIIITAVSSSFRHQKGPWQIAAERPKRRGGPFLSDRKNDKNTRSCTLQTSVVVLI